MLTPLFNKTTDHYKGHIMAPIEFVQYGDFQCEHCTNVYAVVKQLQQTMGDAVLFVYRHFPLANLHPLAIDAAMAAEAAGVQGKFWAMHDIITENQKYLTRASFHYFAEELELDMNAFGNNQKNKRLYQKIINDLDAGLHNGVDCTPTFFINGMRYNGFDDYQSLYKVFRFASRYSIEFSLLT
jgi:protein-disulfide isomerase